MQTRFNIIFLKEVLMLPCLKPYCFLRSNNSRDKVPEARSWTSNAHKITFDWWMKIILKDIAFIWSILAVEKRKEYLLSNNLYIKVPSLMVISKFKNVTWWPWCPTSSSGSFGYIPQIDFPNSTPSIAQD